MYFSPSTFLASSLPVFATFPLNGIFSESFLSFPWLLPSKVLGSLPWLFFFTTKISHPFSIHKSPKKASSSIGRRLRELDKALTGNLSRARAARTTPAQEKDSRRDGGTLCQQTQSLALSVSSPRCLSRWVTVSLCLCVPVGVTLCLSVQLSPKNTIPEKDTLPSRHRDERETLLSDHVTWPYSGTKVLSDHVRCQENDTPHRRNKATTIFLSKSAGIHNRPFFDIFQGLRIPPTDKAHPANSDGHNPSVLDDLVRCCLSVSAKICSRDEFQGPAVGRESDKKCRPLIVGQTETAQPSLALLQTRRHVVHVLVLDLAHSKGNSLSKTPRSPVTSPPSNWTAPQPRRLQGRAVGRRALGNQIWESTPKKIQTTPLFFF